MFLDFGDAGRWTSCRAAESPAVLETFVTTEGINIILYCMSLEGEKKGERREKATVIKCLSDVFYSSI